MTTPNEQHEMLPPKFKPSKSTIFLQSPAPKPNSTPRKTSLVDRKARASPDNNSGSPLRQEINNGLKTPSRSRIVAGIWSNDSRAQMTASDALEESWQASERKEPVSQGKQGKKRPSLFSDDDRKNRRRMERAGGAPENQSTRNIGKVNGQTGRAPLRAPEPKSARSALHNFDKRSERSRSSVEKASKATTPPTVFQENISDAPRFAVGKPLEEELPEPTFQPLENQLECTGEAKCASGCICALEYSRAFGSPESQQSPTANQEYYSHPFVDGEELTRWGTSSPPPPKPLEESPVACRDLDECLQMIPEDADRRSGAYSTLTLQEWLSAGEKILERFRENSRKVQEIMKARSERMRAYTSKIEKYHESLRKRQEESRAERGRIQEGIQASIGRYWKGNTPA